VNSFLTIYWRLFYFRTIIVNFVITVEWIWRAPTTWLATCGCITENCIRSVVFTHSNTCECHINYVFPKRRFSKNPNYNRHNNLFDFSSKNISSLRHPDGASNPNLQSETCREPGNGAEESKDKRSQGSDEGDIEEVPYPPPLQSELLSLSRDGWVCLHVKREILSFFLHFSFRLYRLDSKTRVQSVLNGFTPYSGRLNHNYSLNTNNGKSHDPGGNNGNNPTINMLLYSRPTRCTLDLNVIKKILKKLQFNTHIHIFRSPVEKRT